MNILIDFSSPESIRKVYDEAQSRGIGALLALNENGEREIIIFRSKEIEVTTYQTNKWVRLNTYILDSDCIVEEETFDGKWK